ncbi:AAA family ATPase [Photobacterium damselae]|uniref:AAA family ATPase n=1 Tax=Photobacterium damselae TaxID=38293 RepID=UPI0012AD44F6|nr:AAA family ATPase [Photobacterium damselae]
MKINTDFLCVATQNVTDDFDRPLLSSLTSMQYDFLPRFLPEDMASLDECLLVAFEKAKLEANRVIEDYEGFDWLSLLKEDKDGYEENRVFLEKYKKRLVYVNEAELLKDDLDVFGKMKLINYLSSMCERIIFDYRSFSWSKYHKEEPDYFSESKAFYIRYLYRNREISQSMRTQKYNEQLSTHLKNTRAYMDEKLIISPFIAPEYRDDYGVSSNTNQTSKKVSRKDLYTLQSELDSMIGLEVVKKRISSLVSEIAIRKERKNHGLPTNERSYHMVFTGNSGTGKTVVARIVAQMLYALGVTKKNTFIEATRADLVAGYVGHTAIKTNEVIDSALGGVLFIDEAYALNGSGNDFGSEAITTLLKRMEDERSNLIVIIAGYEQEMDELLESNQGLESRFNRRIHFDDYDNNELGLILKRNIKKNGYTLNSQVSDHIVDIVLSDTASNKSKFSNGRGVRNLFEKIIENQEHRIYKNGRLDQLSKEQLQEILLEDMLSVVK